MYRLVLCRRRTDSAAIAVPTVDKPQPALTVLPYLETDFQVTTAGSCYRHFTVYVLHIVALNVRCKIRCFDIESREGSKSSIAVRQIRQTDLEVCVQNRSSGSFATASTVRRKRSIAAGISGLIDPAHVAVLW